MAGTKAGEVVWERYTVQQDIQVLWCQHLQTVNSSGGNVGGLDLGWL